MATNANQHLINAYIRPYTVETTAVTAGTPVKFGTTDLLVTPAGAASDLMIGVALGKPAESFAVGAVVQVVHPWAVVARMLVGTGGSTRGAKQKMVSDGITDCDTQGGGTNPIYSIGVALQTGVVGDWVAVGLATDSRTKT